MFEDVAQLFYHEAGKLNLLRNIFDATIGRCYAISILVECLRQFEACARNLD